MEIVTNMFQDFRLALRRLARTPGFTALATLALALGIGAHVAIFSLIDALFLRPLPVAEPESLVGVYQSRGGAGFHPLSYPDYVDYRDATQVFSGLAAHYPTAPLSLGIGESSDMVNGSIVTGNYFSLLGVEPARGRLLSPADDDIPGAHPVAVVSYELWQGRLGGREDVVGTVVKVNSVALTVVGVAPRGFQGVRLDVPSEIWIPTMMSRAGYRWCDPFDRECTLFQMIGRLRPGRTFANAEAEMAALSRRVREEHPADAVLGLSVAPLTGLHPDSRPENLRLAGLLLAAVTLLVVVAGANVAGLLLARGLTRRKEIAVRLALGAPRRGLVSLFLAETLTVSIAGGAGGLLVAGWLGRVLVVFHPSDVPLDVGLDATVLGYTALLSLAAGLVVGLVPGIRTARPDLVAALKDTTAMGDLRRPRLLAVFVVVQVALSFVLVSSTGLLMRSLEHVSHPGGLDPASIATLRLRPRLTGYGPERGQALSREVVRRLEALPGVRSVSLGARLPIWHGEGLPVSSPGSGAEAAAWIEEIAPRFFETFGMSLASGRDFDERDVPGSGAVTIVNRALASALWPDRDAVGRLLVVAGRTYEVVGVVEDAGHLNLLQTPAPQIYLPYWQDPAFVDARVAIRTDGDADKLLPLLGREVRAIDPDVPVTELVTMRERLQGFLKNVHLAGRVLGVSGALALVLSAVGLAGILALAVTRRTREIGIRMSLGGSRSHVVGLIVRDAVVLVAAALGLGLAAALAVHQTLTHYLYGVGPRDPSAFVAASITLGLMAVVASWWPARRAAGVDPITALRQE